MCKGIYRVFSLQKCQPALYIFARLRRPIISESVSVPASPKQRPLHSGKWDVRIAATHPSATPAVHRYFRSTRPTDS